MEPELAERCGLQRSLVMAWEDVACGDLISAFGRPCWNLELRTQPGVIW